MSSVNSKLENWRRGLRKATDCRYVGPRPQNETDKDMLIGRKEDVDEITTLVLKKLLVVLHGYSGVGKSSLLQNGLYAVLKESKFEVLVCRRWQTGRDLDYGSEEAVERYLANGIERTRELRDGQGAAPSGLALGRIDGRLRKTLEKKCEAGGGVVLILDQFEELLRQQSELAKCVIKWVVRTGHLSSRIRVVLSLRTDGLHLLDPLLRGVKPFSMERIAIAELSDPEIIGNVIRALRPVAASSDGGVWEKMEEEAARRLGKAWTHAAVKPGLLDLQATLYALYYRARGRANRGNGGDGARATGAHPRCRIETGDLESFVRDAKMAADCSSVFALGLREAMSLKIAHAEQAARDARLDRYLVVGTREMLRRMLPMLSSGDFKVPVRDAELARRTLETELRVLEEELAREAGGGQCESFSADVAVEKLLCDLEMSGDSLLDRQVRVPALQKCFPKGAAGDSTPGTAYRPVDVTAGPMMSASASATLLEEVRRVAFAIKWLEATEIVRRDPDGTLLLVHDGAGVALSDWSADRANDAETALFQLTGSRGQRFAWPEDPDSDGKTIDGVIANLNWRDCTVSTKLERVIFLNCDFKGTTFLDCTLEGVTFVNCLLDDANFEQCDIVGKVRQKRIKRAPENQEEAREKVRLAPSFSVSIGEEAGDDFAGYCGSGERGVRQLFSDTSDVPAMLGPCPPDHEGEWLAHFGESDGAAFSAGGVPVGVTPTSGGVAMIGGRICFLTLYRCVAKRNGGFVFHHVSGEGLSVVEHGGGELDIHDGAIRGISFSRDRREGDEDGGVRIELTVHDSLISNAYFSGGLSGAATFDDSMVFMLLNAGENNVRGFEVSVKNCRYLCLVNTNDPEGGFDEYSVRETIRFFDSKSGSTFGLRNGEALARDLESMDFRYHPHLWEARQRATRRLRDWGGK